MAVSTRNSAYPPLPDLGISQKVRPTGGNDVTTQIHGVRCVRNTDDLFTETPTQIKETLLI
jgi:hypothetical protein